MLLRTRQIVAAACSVSILALSAAQSFAADQASFTVPAVKAAAPARAGQLWRLPAGPDRLVLTGEHDRRDIPFYVTPAQTSGTARLVLSVQSAVSVMPEASELTVFVNNVQVGQTQLGSASTIAIETDLQPGLLQPGFNAISLIANQVHRVDCSMTGTYELWTRIDPAGSGIVFAGVDTSTYDLVALGAGLRGADGQLVIRGHIPTGARLSLIADTLDALQSAVVAARISDFKVEMNDGTSTGPGIDLFVGTTTELAASGVDDRRAVDTGIAGVKVSPPNQNGRAALVVTGQTDQDLHDNVRALAEAAASMRTGGTAAGISAAENAVGRELDGSQTVKLSELGYVPLQFRGRYYQDHVTFRLPADFYAADYDKAFITLDAAYAPGLLQASSLIVKANGRTVSTISLSAHEGGVLKRQRLPVPLGSLRAGENVISIEADLSSQSDLACDPAALANGGPRLTISPDSTITLPRLGRVGHSPDVAATMAGLSDLGEDADKAINLFVPGLRPQSLDAAAVLLGRMAYSSGKVYATRLSSVAPNDGTGDMIAVGPYSSIPSDLLSYVGIEQGGALGASVLPNAASVAENDGWLAAHAATTVDTMSLLPGGQSEGPQGNVLQDFAQPVDIRARIVEMANSVEGYFTSLFGRITGTSDAVADIPRFSPNDNTSIVFAQRTAPTTSGAAWTVVASADDVTLAEGLRRAGELTNWTQLQGAISAVAKDGSGVTTIAAADEQLFETRPRSIVNARLVLAGWFSHNMERYVVGLFSIFILLGIATHMLARRVGRRNQ